MSFDVAAVHAIEILDSRGRPTLEVSVALASGARADAGVPSGASTGTREAVERRDGDPARFGGSGVLGAVDAVNGEIADALSGRSFADLAEVDEVLIDLDSTETKARLGANAIVGVSMAVARAAANDAGEDLFRHLAPAGVAPRLPVPNFNVLNGGAHAQNPLDFQEFMIAPIGATDFSDAYRAGAEIYASLRAKLHELGHTTGLGDEGGFAPEIATAEEALDLLVTAITSSGYEAGRDGVAIALDPAASEFRQSDGTYSIAGASLTTDQLIDRYETLVDRYPIWSIEDGLGEDDWEGWQRLTQRLGDRVQLVGDDVFVTNPAIIRRAIDEGVGNASLIKLNQIGTVTETLAAIALSHASGYAAMISHRSGETSDTFIADLAVATAAGQIKSGAPARGERTAKYNRLAVIAEMGKAPYGLAEHA
jgi:enolase